MFVIYTTGTMKITLSLLFLGLFLHREFATAKSLNDTTLDVELEFPDDELKGNDTLKARRLNDTTLDLELEFTNDELEGNDTLDARHSHGSQSSPRHDCPFGHGKYPIFIGDVEDPNQYFRCSHGSSIIFRCPSTLKFDPNVRGCVWFLREDEGMRSFISGPAKQERPCGCGGPTPTPKPAPCGCTTPTPTPKPTPKPCGCTRKPTPTPTPTPKPCGCKPTTRCGCTPKPTPTPTPTPKPCGCKPKTPCGCTLKPTPTPTPTPKPCGCKHTSTPHDCEIPPPYIPSKPDPAPGPRPTPISALPKCPLEKTPKPVYLPHPTDVRKFYECSWGTAFECECSEGLWFHIGLQACGWPQESSATVITVKFDCFAEVDASMVLLPHSTDSHKFYKIHEGAAYECHCTVGKVFSAEKKSCVDFTVPPCPTDLEEWPIYLPHADHRLFFECAKGKVNLFYCSTGTFFHPDKKQCVASTVNL